MGDRLVQTIYCNNKFYAASYQHWSAGNWAEMENLTESLLEESDFFNNPSKELAVECLMTALDKFWGEGNNQQFGLLPGEVSEVQKEFNDTHRNMKISNDRSAGMITVDEEKSDDWVGWAEAINTFG